MRPQITIVVPTFGIGGVEVRTARLVNAMYDEFAFRIISLDGNIAAASLVTEKVSIETPSTRFAKRNTAVQIVRSGLKLHALRPDLLQTYNWGTFEWWPAAKWTGICPHVHGEDGFSDAERLKPKSIRQLLRRLFLKHCKYVVVPSKKLMQTAAGDWGVPTGIVAHIPNGVNMEAFNGPKNNNKTRITFVSIASLTPVKNHLRLLRAFMEVQRTYSVSLLLAGTGPEEQTIRRFVEENSLQECVQLLGYRNDAPALLKAADCFCLSSDSEQMPISVLEAMAAGCPVLSTDVGDIADMVSEINRPFVVSKDNPVLLKTRMEELVANAGLRARVGRENREKCRRFYSEETMIQSYRKLYRQAVGPAARKV